ncbi:MAG: hypothetical protein WKF99_10695 [Solirubrobacteraceae bacterium]
MADLPAARRATQPQRRFSPDDLADLERAAQIGRRVLVCALVGRPPGRLPERWDGLLHLLRRREQELGGHVLHRRPGCGQHARAAPVVPRARTAVAARRS